VEISRVERGGVVGAGGGDLAARGGRDVAGGVQELLRHHLCVALGGVALAGERAHSILVSRVENFSVNGRKAPALHHGRVCVSPNLTAPGSGAPVAARSSV